MRVLGVFLAVLCMSASFVRAGTRMQSNAPDLCPLCMDSFEESMAALVEVIDAGVIFGGCGQLCGKVFTQTIEFEACTALCGMVGINTFMNLVKKADLSYISLCEDLKVCPTVDCTGNCGAINELTLRPQVASAGDEVKLNVSFTIAQQFGAGQISYSILNDAGDLQVLNAWNVPLFKPAGQTSHVFGIDLPDDDTMEPGEYVVKVSLCDGECGSKRPHSALYDTQSIQLTVQ
eukprot:ANDGO_06561.mRNA.1 hypothetical protein